MRVTFVVDVAVTALWLALAFRIALAVFARRPQSRHRWAELDSTDVAHALRRRQRP